MDFQVGDQVIHWSFGPGEIVELDEKEISGKAETFYVFQTPTVRLWVPRSDGEMCSLRYVTPASEFKQLFEILTGPASPLSEDRFERRTKLNERLKDGGLESVCHVLRDLTVYGRTKKLNEYDQTIMERARNTLVSEWAISLKTPRMQALKELGDLLAQ